jgi:hypothetical protein
MVHIYGAMMLVPYTLASLYNNNMPWLNNKFFSILFNLLVENQSDQYAQLFNLLHG